MIRRITGISAHYCTRNSTSLDLVKKALYWQKMKGLGSSTTLSLTSFDKKGPSSEKNQECLNQENTGKNLTFFLKNLPKTTLTAENPMTKSPVPKK